MRKNPKQGKIHRNSESICTNHSSKIKTAEMIMLSPPKCMRSGSESPEIMIKVIGASPPKDQYSIAVKNNSYNYQRSRGISSGSTVDSELDFEQNYCEMISTYQSQTKSKSSKDLKNKSLLEFSCKYFYDAVYKQAPPTSSIPLPSICKL